MTSPIRYPLTPPLDVEGRTAKELLGYMSRGSEPTTPSGVSVPDMIIPYNSNWLGSRSGATVIAAMPAAIDHWPIYERFPYAPTLYTHARLSIDVATAGASLAKHVLQYSFTPDVGGSWLNAAELPGESVYVPLGFAQAVRGAWTRVATAALAGDPWWRVVGVDGNDVLSPVIGLGTIQFSTRAGYASDLFYFRNVSPSIAVPGGIATVELHPIGFYNVDGAYYADFVGEYSFPGIAGWSTITPSTVYGSLLGTPGPSGTSVSAEGPLVTSTTVPGGTNLPLTGEDSQGGLAAFLGAPLRSQYIPGMNYRVRVRHGVSGTYQISYVSISVMMYIPTPTPHTIALSEMTHAPVLGAPGAIPDFAGVVQTDLIRGGGFICPEGSRYLVHVIGLGASGHLGTPAHCGFQFDGPDSGIETWPNGNATGIYLPRLQYVSPTP